MTSNQLSLRPSEDEAADLAPVATTVVEAFGADAFLSVDRGEVLGCVGNKFARYRHGQLVHTDLTLLNPSTPALCPFTGRALVADWFHNARVVAEVASDGISRQLGKAPLGFKLQETRALDAQTLVVIGYEGAVAFYDRTQAPVHPLNQVVIAHGVDCAHAIPRTGLILLASLDGDLSVLHAVRTRERVDVRCLETMEDLTAVMPYFMLDDDYRHSRMPQTPAITHSAQAFHIDGTEEAIWRAAKQPPLRSAPAPKLDA